MIYLSLGSNLPSKVGNRFDNIDFSLLLLENYGISIIKKSNFYETPSYPDNKNPKFINLVVKIKTDLPPVDLLSVLLFIEEKIGRKRDVKNQPRTCDIDIIDYKGEIYDLKYKDLNLLIPHKEMNNRNFVLFPLKDVEPNWIHPKTKETIDTLIKKLPTQDRKSILKVKKS